MKLDVKKLNLLSRLMRRTIDEGEIPGASVMVIKDGCMVLQCSMRVFLQHRIYPK